MEKSAHPPNRTLLLLLIAIVAFFALVSFVLCILAEFHRTKADELKFDGRSCSLPRSLAFRLGVSALICLSTAQIFGNFIAFGLVFSAVKAGFRRSKSPAICSGVLMTVSWMSYGVAAILISTAASMNKGQPYGKGWLDGDCYVVKDGVFAGAGVLVLFTLACILLTYCLTIRPILRAPNKPKPQTQQR